MHLKRWNAVDWQELSRIEHPTHARFLLERLININGFGVCHVRGLKDVIWSDTEWSRRGVLDTHSHGVLMKRVERGEVFLVQDLGVQPSLPLLHQAAGEDRDEWQIADNTLDHSVRDHVEWMLGRARESKGFWAPIIVPAKPSPPPLAREAAEELSVTNPRWEHVDQKRGQDSPEAAVPDDAVMLMADVGGATDGTLVVFKIFDTAFSPPKPIATVRGEVEGGVGKAQWPVKIRTGKDDRDPSLEFTAEVRRVVSAMAKVALQGVMPEIFLRDSPGADSAPLMNTPWKLMRRDAVIEEGETGEDGKVALKNPLRADTEYELHYLGRIVALKTRFEQKLAPPESLAGAQQRLAMLGYDSGPDGDDCGPLTSAALHGFRTDKALGHGEHDSATCDGLKNDIGA